MLHVIPWTISFLTVLISILIYNHRILKKVDHSLLLTFVALFIFIGNIGRIPAFHDALVKIIDDHEMLTAILASQFMSNVPAAILLSGFTDRYTHLIIGVNLGGLGTLIASMASLISFKFLAREMPEKKSAYLLYFTISNLVFLALLMSLAFILKV